MLSAARRSPLACLPARLSDAGCCNCMQWLPLLQRSGGGGGGGQVESKQVAAAAIVRGQRAREREKVGNKLESQRADPFTFSSWPAGRPVRRRTPRLTCRATAERRVRASERVAGFGAGAQTSERARGRGGELGAAHNRPTVAHKTRGGRQV